MILKPGTRLGPYEILSPIEAGGMGSVFRALDTRLSREVAIKVLPVDSMRDERLVKRFQREARAAAAVTHSNVVAVHDVGEAEISLTTPLGPSVVRLRFLVEEYVEGLSLRRALRAGRPPVGKVIAIAEGIARGLMAAHEKGLIHRDLKPENILIDKTGKPKIADFGLVRWIYPESAAPSGPSGPVADADFLHDTLTKTGFVVGTMGYMSPEQARGDEVGPPSDLFVFGILLYELLTGVAPFARPNLEAGFKAILKAKAPPLLEQAPDTPPALVRIVERCLEKSLERRYTSAAQVLQDLERVRSSLKPNESGAAKGTAAAAARIGKPAARRETSPLAWLLASLGIVVAFGVGLVVGGGRMAPSHRVPPEAPREWSASWTPETCSGTLREADPIEIVVSRDGRALAFTSMTGEEGDVFATPIQGPTPPRRISTDETGGRAPFLTRGGSHVLYSSSRGGAHPALWEASVAEESTPTKLLDDAEEPALSPDETTLTFLRHVDSGIEIWLARRDGSGAHRLAGAQKSDWRFPVFTAEGNEVLVFDVRPDLQAASARLLRVPLRDPRPLPVRGGRALDPAGRATPVRSGLVLVRAWGDRSILALELDGGVSHRMPFGAGLVACAAPLDARFVVTRSEGGSPILWRR